MSPARLSALLLVAACHAPRPAAVSPERAPDRIWFDGASNIRGFTCRSDSARVTVATLAMSVTSLDCGIRTQSRHLHEALAAKSAPTIEFRLADYRLGEGGTDTPIELRGTLRIAGAERPVTLAGVLHRDPTGTLRLRGEHRLRPTDFGVVPPRRFAGLLRVRDAVTVHFDVALPTPGTNSAETAR
jgi:polyisoprenoid-binding protein YceI